MPSYVAVIILLYSAWVFRSCIGLDWIVLNLIGLDLGLDLIPTELRMGPWITYDLLEHGLQYTAHLLIPKYRDAVELDSHYRHCTLFFNEGDWMLRHLAARASEFLFAWGICLAWSAFRDFHRRRVKSRTLAAGIAMDGGLRCMRLK